MLSAKGYSTCMKGGIRLTAPMIDRIIKHQREMTEAQPALMSPSEDSSTEQVPPEVDVVTNYQNACEEEGFKCASLPRKKKRLSKKERDEKSSNPFLEQLKENTSKKARRRKTSPPHSLSVNRQQPTIEEIMSGLSPTHPSPPPPAESPVNSDAAGDEETSAPPCYTTDAGAPEQATCGGNGSPDEEAQTSPPKSTTPKKTSTPRKRKKTISSEDGNSSSKVSKKAGVESLPTTPALDRRRLPNSQRAAAREEEELRNSLRMEFMRSMLNHCVLPMLQGLLN